MKRYLLLWINYVGHGDQEFFKPDRNVVSWIKQKQYSVFQPKLLAIQRQVSHLVILNLTCITIKFLSLCCCFNIDPKMQTYCKSVKSGGRLIQQCHHFYSLSNTSIHVKYWFCLQNESSTVTGEKRILTVSLTLLIHTLFLQPTLVHI